MKPSEMAARFAAFTWYTNHRRAPGHTAQSEARRFSKENWQVFLPVVNARWGKLLLRIAEVRAHSQAVPAAVHRSRKRQLAAVV
jgi:hypothetical protein